MDTNETTQTSALSPRDAIREAVLNDEAASEIVSYSGFDIEIKYPSLADLLMYRDAQNDDNIMARAIINNCYVPGTDTRVFEDADVELLMQKKFTPDMRRLNKAINKILGGDEELVQEVKDGTKSPQE